MLLTSKEAGVASYQFQLAESYGALADLVADNGDIDASREANAQAIGILAELTLIAPGNPDYQAEIADRFQAVAALDRDEGKREEALESQEKAAVILDDLVKREPGDPDYRHTLAWAKSRLGDLYAESNRKEDSVKAANESVQQMQYLLVNDLDPEQGDAKRPGHRQDLARLYENLARHWRKQNRKEDAAKCFEKAVQQWDALSRSGAGNLKEVNESLASARAELEKLQGS